MHALIARLPLPILETAVAAFVTGAAFIQPADAVTFTDAGTFSAATWSNTIFGGGTVGLTRETTGGNPGAFLRVQTIPSGGSIVIGAFINSAATWDPSTQGAIADIDLDVDLKLFSGVPGFPGLFGGQGFGIVLRQGGQVFGNGFAATGDPVPNFVSRTITGAGQTNFGLISSSGNTDVAINPDFTASGSLIEFGISFANSGGAPISGTTAGYDNLGITVNAAASGVPEPGAFLLLGVGLAGLAFTRRKRMV